MSDQTERSRRDELETLLPFYLNGTLDGRELEEVEAWLASDPNAQAALAEADAEYSATLTVNEAVRPPADAALRFARSLDAIAGPQAEAAGPGLVARLWRGFVGAPAGLAWAVAGLAVAVMIAQGLIDRDAPPGYEMAGDGQQGADTPFVLVTFSDDATMTAIGELLAKHGASLAGGPLPGGLFRIAIPVADKGAYDRIAAALAASELVTQVMNGKGPGSGS